MKLAVLRIALAMLVVAAAATVLALRELDGYLGQLAHEGYGTYTTSDLAPFVPRELPEHVRGVLEVWENHSATARTALNWHLGVDTFVFIPLYAALLAVLLYRALDAVRRTQGGDELRRLGSRWWVPLVGLVVADLVENATRAAIIWTGKTPGSLVYGSWFSTWAKWTFAALVLVLLAALAVQVRRAAPSMRLGESDAERNPDHALWRLRIPLALVAIWSLFVLFDPSGQVHDLVRRWFDSRALLAQGAGTLVATSVLGLASWTVARRVLFVGDSVVGQNKDEKSLSMPALAFIAVLTGCIAYGADLENLAGTAIVFATLFVLSAVALFFTRNDISARERGSGVEKREQTAHAVAGTEAENVKRLAWGVAVAPPIVLLLTLGAAMVVPAVVLSARPVPTTLSGSAAAAVAILAPVAAVTLTAVAAGCWPAVSARWKAPHTIELRHAAVGLAAVAVAGAAIAWHVEVPPALASITIVVAALVLIMLLLGEGQRYGESHRPPAILGMLGFVRVPVATLTAAVFVVSSLLDQGGYHDVHHMSARTPSPQGVDLIQVWKTWKRTNCVATASDPVPLLLVASHGGGIRAAYWTGSVLTELLGSPAPRVPACDRARTTDRVFALGGASGGAVGVTSYLGNQGGSATRAWYEASLGRPDFLSPAVSWGVLVDLPRTFIGFDGPDRARRLEEAWQRDINGMQEDFFAPGKPLLLLSSAQVETGCRMNVARIRLTEAPPSPPPTTCNAILKRPATTLVRDDTVRPPVVREVPDAALTSEVLDHLCPGHGSLERATAALLAARFPYVSPSGRMPVCGSDGHTALVDGGYAENSGGQGLLDLWARLRPLVAAHNRRQEALVVPIFVHIDNHYAKAVGAAAPGRTQELLVPPTTAGRPDKLDDVGVEQFANGRFSADVPGMPGTTCEVGKAATQRFVRIAPPDSPGVPAPLAWTLSRMATDELDRQRLAAFEDDAAKRLRLIVRDRQKLACDIEHASEL